MNSGDSGDFTRLKYDQCEYEVETHESVGPFEYRMKLFAQEHPRKCRYDPNVFILRPNLVDQESELKNITRVNSRCPRNKYNPDCKTSKTCASTFDTKFFPVTLIPENCPIVHNNIKKITHRGFNGSYAPFCSTK